MCIALLSTRHPDYPLILLNNRDEFLTRPTAAADWWAPPHQNVLGGRDLLRKEQGTWLGVTKQGRLAVLTNFREEGEVTQEAKSRGGIVNAFLTSAEDTQAFVGKLFEGDAMKNIGGFSLICGLIGQPLAMLSNRMSGVGDVVWFDVSQQGTIGLSNAAVGDRSWPKVLEGERRIDAAIEASIAEEEDREEFVDRLFEVLNTDTLPKWKENQTFQSFVLQLKESIFIPVLDGHATKTEAADKIAAAKVDDKVEVKEQTGQAVPEGLSGPYGTQRQTVMLLDQKRQVYFVERTPHGSSRTMSNDPEMKAYCFKIEQSILPEKYPDQSC